MKEGVQSAAANMSFLLCAGWMHTKIQVPFEQFNWMKKIVCFLTVQLKAGLTVCGEAGKVFRETEEVALNGALFATDSSKTPWSMENHVEDDNEHSLPLDILLDSECSL